MSSKKMPYIVFGIAPPTFDVFTSSECVCAVMPAAIASIAPKKFHFFFMSIE